MRKAKFIVLNGFAGAGKSTIAKRYIADHPLALTIEGDELIVNMGHWLENEPTARGLVYEMIKSLAGAHLSLGHDVVLPYLVTDATHIKEFKQIADEQGAQFFNILLSNEKDVAIKRLLERGTWGEAGTDPLSDKDASEIERLFNLMQMELGKQVDAVVIEQKDLSIEQTYSLVLQAVSAL